MDGGYGADAATTFDVGTGDRLILEALVELYYIMGLLSHERKEKEGE